MADAGRLERSICNCAALRRASRRVSQFYDAALAPAGLKSTQFAMLVEIGRRADEPPTIRDLGDILVMDQSTIGQNLRPLERAGLIAIETDAQDRRRRNISLTRKGRARLAAARPLWQEAQRQFESAFGEKESTRLRATLLTIATDLPLGDAAND